MRRSLREEAMNKNSQSKSKGFSFSNFMRDFGIIIIFVVLVAVLAIVSPNHSFAQPRNLINILKQTSINGILAMGMMFVIVSDGIDLSVGSIIALTAVVSATFAHPGEYPLIVPILLAAIVGLICGIVNGVAIAYGEIPPFIVTLGTMTILRGLALIVSGGGPVTNISPAFEGISGGSLLGIPYLAIFYIIVIAISAFVLNKTVFGRRVYVVGGNQTAANVSGVSVNKIRVAVYSISGLLAGLCGMLMASRTISGSPTAGESYEMDAIAAVVIGGVSMTGGVGKWYGVVIGALMIAVIANGLDILGISSNYQKIIKGLIIIFAVFFDIKGQKNKK